MQVTKGIWCMHKQCVPGSLSSSPARAWEGGYGNSSRIAATQLTPVFTSAENQFGMYSFPCLLPASSSRSALPRLSSLQALWEGGGGGGGRRKKGGKRGGRRKKGRNGGEGGRQKSKKE